MRILITGVGGPAGASLALQSRERGHEVIGVDMADTMTARIADEFHTVPAATDPDAMPALARIARRSGAELVIPTVQEELPLIAAAAAEFPAPVVVSPFAAIALAHDKRYTMTALAKAGVAVPETFDGMPTGNGPWVIKPRRSRGGRGVQVVEESAGIELDREFELIQEFVPGDEYCPQVYRCPDSGEVTVVVLEKLELSEGIVGNALGVRRRDNGEASDIAAIAEDAVVALGLVGPIDLDVRRRANGEPVVLEINARFGANSAAAPELLDAVLAHAERVSGLESAASDSAAGLEEAA